MKKRILIAEDDIFVSEVYSVKLIEMGFEAIIVRNGNEALKEIETRPPDLMLLDIMMPELDGIELLGRLHEKGILGKFPIILLTNVNEKEMIKKAEEYGVDDYLVKSHHTPAEVIEVVNKKLGL